ncbi:hypothetical protein Tsubulata_042050 [Turnera subulata]|uniref:CCHC-type domain-containing protein n=1 Tax=Turnera subulata TaxID=218843 RepID=A0A9Q0JGG4_9ROSI|nr:hypothetical protein Tsubulata_042050 [Turnera subulata]
MAAVDGGEGPLVEDEDEVEANKIEAVDETRDTAEAEESLDGELEEDLDDNTSNPSRAKFARVVVCLDLTKPLKGEVYLDGEPLKVGYEGLPDICYICGKPGHNIVVCPEAAHSRNTSTDTFGATPMELEGTTAKIHNGRGA